MGGIPNAEIRRNRAARSPVGLDRLVFAGRQPEFHRGQVLADGNNVPEMPNVLDVAGIVPAEVAVSRVANERGYLIGELGALTLE